VHLIVSGHQYDCGDQGDTRDNSQPFQHNLEIVQLRLAVDTKHVGGQPE
jgi:hypothetical protein